VTKSPTEVVLWELSTKAEEQLLELGIMRELNFIMREKFRGDIPFKWELHTVSIIEIPEIQLNAARTFRVLFSRNQLNAARTFRVMFPEIN